jgi:hypothetical protein
LEETIKAHGAELYLNSVPTRSIAVLSRYLSARKSMPEKDAEYWGKGKCGGVNREQ